MAIGKKKATILTMLTTTVTSILISIFGLVYNQGILEVYGASANGLISTLIQFVSIFAVLEGGFNTAAIVALYKPYTEKNYALINDILFTTKRYFAKIGTVVSAGAFVAGLVYLNFVKSPYTYAETLLLLVITILGTGITLIFGNKYNTLFNGFNQQYIQNNIMFVSKFVTWMISMLLIMLRQPIIWVYFVNTANVILNVVICKCWVSAKMKPVTFQGSYDKTLIQGTNDMFFQKIANTIFTSTDLVLISSGLGLVYASIYNVYYQIFNMISNLVSSVIVSPFNSFGQLINEENQEKFHYNFSIYFRLVIMVTTIVLTAVAVAILGFVKIYTINVEDVEYIVPTIPLLMFVQMFLMNVNKPFGMLLNITKKFKEQNVSTISAAIVNIIFSVILMNVCGIQGIIIGSILGVAIILFTNIYKCHKHNLVKKTGKAIWNIALNFVLGIFLIICVYKYVPFYTNNIIIWLVVSAGEFLLIAGFIVLVNLIIAKKQTMDAMSFVLHLIKK